MKLRITQPGFESYSGRVGVVSFKDGLSDGDVLMVDALRISAVWLTEWEDGTTANVGQMILNNMDTPAYIGMPERERLHGNQPVSDAAEREQQEDQAAASQPAAPVYSRAELEAIADKKGINGLREVATPMGVKGTSIAALIESILKAQPDMSPDEDAPAQENIQSAAEE